MDNSQNETIRQALDNAIGALEDRLKEFKRELAEHGTITPFMLRNSMLSYWAQTAEQWARMLPQTAPQGWDKV